MNSRCFLRALAAVAALGLSLASPTEAKAAEAAPKPQLDSPQPLYVLVEMPVTDPICEDRVTEMFYDYVALEFRVRGYPGQVKPLERSGKLPAGAQQLTLNVVRWRTLRSGLIDLTFTAEFTAPQGKVDLGMISETNSLVAVMPGDRFALRQAFEDIARTGARRVLEKLWSPPEKP